MKVRSPGATFWKGMWFCSCFFLWIVYEVREKQECKNWGGWRQMVVPERETWNEKPLTSAKNPENPNGRLLKNTARRLHPPLLHHHRKAGDTSFIDNGNLGTAQPWRCHKVHPGTSITHLSPLEHLVIKTNHHSPSQMAVQVNLVLQ